jgi:cholesterol transport system auxiliary component
MMITIGKITRLAGLLLLVSGCSMLPQPVPVTQDQYVLEYTSDERLGVEPRKDAPVMIVTRPRAHGGYDTPRIAYMEKRYGLRYFTRSLWADVPAVMLAPLIAAALQQTGEFQAFQKPPGALSASLRLDTELVRFHQDFTRQPSVMRLTLRAELIDAQRNKVIAIRQFDITEPAASDDAYGGVVAANRAVARLLDELALFCLANRP